MSTNNLVFEAIGTRWQIDFYSFVSQETTSKVFGLIKKRIDKFDKNYSRFRNDSFIKKMSYTKQRLKMPKDAKTIFDLYQKLYKITNGLFTPLVGSFLEDIGYDADYSLVPKNTLRQIPKWENAIEYNYPYIKLKQDAVVDIGAIGKGYLIDIIGEFLIKNRIDSFCIDAGGDMLIKNYPQIGMKIGLENPNNLSQVIGIATLNNASICASSGSRRKWANFHHIINPKNLQSPTEIIATWVISKSALIADAMATCLFLVDKSKLQNCYSFEYLILKKDFSFEKSFGFNAQLFLKE